ncbi:hypothetical protein LXA43DRAFT_484207 [Ganoderma leucocontextum]|nr:hypothetical protein LXA43DRAFT_484207 [Ganoderma leucocontextum]
MSAWSGSPSAAYTYSALERERPLGCMHVPYKGLVIPTQLRRRHMENAKPKPSRTRRDIAPRRLVAYLSGLVAHNAYTLNAYFLSLCITLHKENGHTSSHAACPPNRRLPVARCAGRTKDLETAAGSTSTTRQRRERTPSAPCTYVLGRGRSSTGPGQATLTLTPYTQRAPLRTAYASGGPAGVQPYASSTDGACRRGPRRWQRQLATPNAAGLQVAGVNEAHGTAPAPALATGKRYLVVRLELAAAEQCPVD